VTVVVTPRTRGRRHLLDVEGMTRDEIEGILELAVEMREARAARWNRRLLEAETVGLAFYEASTRTRVSFELAAKALGATVVDLHVGTSSVAKGETLIDTALTLERTGVTILVLRHPSPGAPERVARGTGLGVVNGGDGAHAHPTQALADALTLREHFGALDGRLVTIVGDVVHSRVARSNIHCLQALGARVRVAGPAAWVEGFESWAGLEIATSLAEGLREADAVMALRAQLERGAVLPPELASWRLDTERMGLARPDAPILHPGPTNEGVELTAELASGPRSLIGQQVSHGVPVRMAVLAMLARAS
jgi:aspartate carbamoyltransferase catalytic subunit